MIEKWKFIATRFASPERRQPHAGKKHFPISNNSTALLQRRKTKGFSKLEEGRGVEGFEQPL